MASRGHVVGRGRAGAETVVRRLVFLAIGGIREPESGVVLRTSAVMLAGSGEDLTQAIASLGFAGPNADLAEQVKGLP